MERKTMKRQSPHIILRDPKRAIVTIAVIVEAFGAALVFISLLVPGKLFDMDNIQHIQKLFNN
jgi:hypothetical protein